MPRETSATNFTDKAVLLHAYQTIICALLRRAWCSDSEVCEAKATAAPLALHPRSRGQQEIRCCNQADPGKAFHCLSCRRNSTTVIIYRYRREGALKGRERRRIIFHLATCPAVRAWTPASPMLTSVLLRTCNPLALSDLRCIVQDRPRIERYVAVNRTGT